MDRRPRQTIRNAYDDSPEDHMSSPTSNSQAMPVRQRLTMTAILSLARWTPYLESEMGGLRDVVRPGSVCIDVGSAAGLYSAVLSGLAGPAGEVHSIEPLPFAHLAWARLLNVRRLPNVRHHSLALSTEAGTEAISVPFGPWGLVTGRSFLLRKAGGPDPNAEFAGQVSVNVTVDRLDDFCAREGIDRVDFIKIDVEGAELQVLEGGAKVIEAHQPTMLIEIEERHTARYGHSAQDVTGWLRQRGYAMHIWRGGWREIDHIEAGVRNYLFRALPSRGQDNG
jgi:FkbM family methyltransferase